MAASPVPSTAPAVPFTDVTAASAVDFRHDHGGRGDKYMPENMGPGLAVLDVDGDDRLDLFFVQGAPVDGRPPAPERRGHRLFRQTPDGTFRDVSKAAGVDVVGVGMGVCYGDVDRDGDADIFVTQFGADLLFIGAGDGTFREEAQARGLVGEGWSTGCTFFDPDLDGDLDLFVASYVDFTVKNHKYCGNAKKELRSYCHPDVYGAADDRLFLNDGHGRFHSAGRGSGIVPSPEAKGLGVLAHDFDGDGNPDLFVANDSTMNQLYLGNGKGGFEESALLVGVGYNRAGRAEAGMGVELGDVDGDGRAELFLTHLDRETNTLYRPLGPDLYADATDTSGLGPPSLPHVGFGTAFLDFDLDGDLDLAVVNGHILDNIHLFAADRSYRQPAQLFENVGGRFRELPGALPNTEALVGRGLVAADLDRDGDTDLVLTQNDGEARVLRNNAVTAGSGPAPSVTVTLQGPEPIFGARLTFHIGRRTATRFVPGARGYLSQGPPQIQLGLGTASAVDRLEIRWPDGQIETYGPFAAGARVVLHREPTTPPRPTPPQGDLKSSP